MTWFRRLHALAALVVLVSPNALRAQKPRTTGRIGEYTPPRDWPVRQRTFDLLHQRIAISYDLDKRSVAGEVQTRLIVTAAPES
jgi:hypothetical protein